MGSNAKRLLAILSILFLFVPCVHAADCSSITSGQTASCTSVTQYGISYVFDAEYTCGTYANGDFWCQGPLTITDMTPAFASDENGAMINPTQSMVKQGFRYGYDYDSTYNLSLPYTSPESGTVSVVKSIAASSSSYAYVTTMGVLTIVTSVPAGNGSTVFRPPYAGTTKTHHALSEIQSDRVLSLVSELSGESYSTLATLIKMPQIDIGVSSGGAYGRSERRLSPSINMPCASAYFPDIFFNWTKVITTLSLDDTYENKLQSLIYLLQAGIDIYYARETMALGGSDTGDGHTPGKQLLVAYTAYILNNSDMKVSAGKEHWWENRATLNGLWDSFITEDRYWHYYAVYIGYNLEYADPYGFVDGGASLDHQYNDYQNVTLNNCKTIAFFMDRLPGMTAAMSNAASTMGYGARMVTHGVQLRPDPCAPGTKTVIEGVTVGNPTIITSTGHPVQNGDLLRVGKLLGTDAALLNTIVGEASLTATVIDANSFSVNVNTTGGTITVDAGISYYVHGYGRLWGNDPSSSMCILDGDVDYYNSASDWACTVGEDCGRFPLAWDGAIKDSGQRDYPLLDELWTTYYGGGEEADETAPILAQVTPVPTPSSNQSPQYTFSSDEACAITFGGTCGDGSPFSAVIGNTTVSWNLAFGTYSNCTITCTDASGNASTPLAITSFSIIPASGMPMAAGGGCTFSGSLP